MIHVQSVYYCTVWNDPLETREYASFRENNGKVAKEKESGEIS